MGPRWWQSKHCRLKGRDTISRKVLRFFSSCFRFDDAICFAAVVVVVVVAVFDGMVTGGGGFLPLKDLVVSIRNSFKIKDKSEDEDWRATLQSCSDGRSNRPTGENGTKLLPTGRHKNWRSADIFCKCRFNRFYSIHVFFFSLFAIISLIYLRLQFTIRFLKNENMRRKVEGLNLG